MRLEILFWVFGGVSMTAVLVMLVWVRWLFDKPEKAGAIIRRAHDGVWKCKMMGLLGMWGYLGFSFCGFKGMLFVLSGAPLVNFLTPEAKYAVAVLLTALVTPLISEAEKYALKCYRSQGE